uniref:hypothetical protein n=1 Tax=Amycolatopsis sp. CA-151526 TaxID=3239921 RepID=UPI003F495E4C
MTTVDPAAAAKAANALLQGKVELIKQLAGAQNAETPVKAAIDALQAALSALPTDCERKNLEAAEAAAKDAIKDVRAFAASCKQNALAGGWTAAELAELNLVKVRPKKAPKPKVARNTSASAKQGDADSVAVAAEARDRPTEE